MFYDRFVQLCEEKGVKPTNACIESGLSRGLAAKWKSTKANKPSADVLEKLSAYFGKSIDLILGNEPKEKATIDSVDDDLKEYLEELRERPEMRMLFSTTKTATKAQIEAIVKMVEEMQGNK